METLNGHRNTFKFTIGDNLSIVFDSDFDSGNLASVTQQDDYTYVVTPANDAAGIETTRVLVKSWFYFSVGGFPAGSKINLTILSINILFSMYNKEPIDGYKAVFSHDQTNWQRVKEPNELEADGTNLNLKFSFTFEETRNTVYFAFLYPYTYVDCQGDLYDYNKLYKDDPDIYFHKETIALSLERRNVDLVTITSYDNITSEVEPYFNDELFPFKDLETRSRKFKLPKKIVMITARVHPGEVSSSWTMNGIIRFLLNKNDIRAHNLRKMFVFKLIPLLNPDGVAHGYYRLDTMAQNLNRYYNEPDPNKTPSIYAISSLLSFYAQEGSLVFFSDLHGHAARKGCFLYGNSTKDFVTQVETQLFANVLSVNCMDLDLGCCNFSKKQMNSRDRGEKLTKDGCGRVVGYKYFNLVHSYTIECGYHFSTEPNTLPPPANLGKKFYKSLVCEESEKPNFIGEQIVLPSGETRIYYNPETYANLGKALIVSILDLFDGNPCSRIVNSEFQSIENIRLDMAKNLSKKKRFRKEPHLGLKTKNINTLAPIVFPHSLYSKASRAVNEREKPPLKLTINTEIPAVTSMSKRSESLNRIFKLLPRNDVDPKSVKNVVSVIDSVNVRESIHFPKQQGGQTGAFKKSLFVAPSLRGDIINSVLTPVSQSINVTPISRRMKESSLVLPALQKASKQIACLQSSSVTFNNKK